MKPTILVVDDDPILRDIYEVILGESYNLHLASSGKEALEFLKSHTRPDLILLDIHMPEMDGYEVCQKIRENTLFSYLKIVFVSAKSTNEDRLHGYEVGADDYITKPFEEKELLAKVKAFLRLKNVEEIDKIKGDFLSLITHETRTPLTGILGFADLLRESPNLSEEEKEFVELIISGGKKLLHLSERTTLLSNLKSGNIEMNKVNIKLDELLADCQQKFAPRAEEKHLSFHVQSDAAVEISGDPKILPHAFEAVYDNAVKFAREGTAIEVSLHKTGGHVQVEIANEGENILEEHRENIFDEFFVQHVDHHHEGHGLSLAIARRIVGAHDGTLSVRNQDKGPVFVFAMQP